MYLVENQISKYHKTDTVLSENVDVSYPLIEQVTGVKFGLRVAKLRT
jgi:hypothetical protein